MRVRKDQKGFTIVEVLIATAILSIVVLTVCAFILVGSRSYASANSDINVQQEAQLSLNQMSDVLIDTTRSVNYVGYDASGTPEKALKDAEFTFTPEDKSLIMYNGVVEENMSPGGTPTTEVKEGNGNKHYHFYWSKEAEKLYYAQQDVKPGDVNPSAVSFPAPPTYDPSNPTALPAGWVELASHVTDFSVDLSQVEEKRVVMLALTFLDGRKEYVTSNNVTIRNKVGVNDAELLPLDRKKTLDVKIMDAPILEPGEEFHFSIPKVSGNNVADKSVTWAVTASGSPTNGTTFIDPANGILRVAVDEPAGTVKVAVTTNAKDSEGNQASCPADVYIKRVTTVNLSLKDSSDTETDDSKNEVSAGEEFTIGSVVGGEKLGVQCNGCTEDISHDHDVVNWRITQGAEAVETVDVGDYKKDTKYRVKTGTAEGTVIKIAATSYLGQPTSRLYPAVDGEITLTVAKSKKNIDVPGGLHWGASADLTFTLDYPPDFNKTGQGYYVVCARIREYGTEGGDKIMLYRTEGNTTRVTPDIFGVEDISKPWYLSLQVLDPGSHLDPGVGLSNQLSGDLGAQVNDPRVKALIDEYLNHCDSSGTYIGTKYPHTGKYEGLIRPPQIYYEYDGKKNLEGELKLKTVSVMTGPWENSFRVDYVKNTRDEVLGYWFANNNVKFSAYKETSDGLKKLYGYNAAGNYYEGNSSQYGGILRLDEIQNAAGVKIKVDQNGFNNSPQEAPNAVGKYRLIPTIIYEQGQEADHAGGVSIYYVNYWPKYKVKQCYEAPKSTVYFEITSGGNVDAFWSYHNSQFTKGEIYFPTPSENGFVNYFDREQRDWQNAKKQDSFRKIVKNGGNDRIYYQSSSMRCRYVKDKNVYELELFYKYTDSVWNQTVEASAGVFQCAADGTRWARKDPGTYDSQLEKDKDSKPSLNATANVNFWMEGRQYNGKMYIPLPSEMRFSGYDNSDFSFGFALGQSAEQSRDWRKVKYQESGQTGAQDVQFPRLTCTYDSAADTYTLRINDRNGNYVAAFTCKSSGKQWTQQ